MKSKNLFQDYQCIVDNRHHTTYNETISSDSKVQMKFAHEE
ncbi:hypothetical protein ACJDU8_06330 [Clostridium sp. WILCCON 0269]|uniref:Uncharacterized protein n=1 Tax=Candidatus Clostridium eludens TaxID=3381663 RepID=A0ABW8SHX3_9CLOT